MQNLLENIDPTKGIIFAYLQMAVDYTFSSTSVALRKITSGSNSI
jgi:hypothetical protein